MDKTIVCIKTISQPEIISMGYKLESTGIKSSKNSSNFQGNTFAAPVQAGFDRVLMYQSQPSQFQIFKAQHNKVVTPDQIMNIGYALQGVLD